MERVKLVELLNEREVSELDRLAGELDRLEGAMGWLEWFKFYPGNFVQDEQYWTDEWQEAIHKNRKKIYEMFMMKHGETDVHLLGPRLGCGWYQRDLITVINYICKR